MNQKDKAWWLKTIAGAIVVIAIVVYWWWSSQNPNQDKTGASIILGIVCLAMGILYFKEKLQKLFAKKSEDLPPTLSEKEILEIIKEEANSRWNNLRVEKIYEWTRSKTINKNQIYARKVNMDLDDEQFIIIINATYPKIASPSVYPPYRIDEEGNEIALDKDDYYIEKLMNAKSVSPDAEPDRIITEMGVDQFGRPIGKEEKIIHPKEEKKEDVI